MSPEGQENKPVTAVALVSQRPGYLAEASGGPGALDRIDEVFNLRDLTRVFLKRKWTILIIFVVFTLFSVMRTYVTPPVYRASATIQIEKFIPRVFDYKDVAPTEFSDDNNDFYNTIYELLKSRTLVERAVEELGLRRGSPSDSATDAKDLKDAKDAKDAAAPPAPGSGNSLKEFLTRLMGGPPTADVDRATLDDNARIAAFQSSLAVEPVRRSRLVRVHFDSTDPFFAAKAVNTLTQAFININLERRFEASTYAKTFLEEKLAQTKSKLEDSERELVRYSRELEVLTGDDKQNVFNQNLQEFNVAVAKAEQERIKAEVLMRQAKDDPDSLSIVQENRNVQALRQQKAKFEAEYQDNLKIYKPAFPKMLQLQSEISEVNRQIKAEIEEVRKTTAATYRAALTQEQMLKERLGGAQRQLLDLQGRSIRYSILKREVDTNRQLYDGLLQRLKEVSVAGGVGMNNISIVDKAEVPIYPYKPDLRGNVSSGLAFGLLMGLLVAWLLEHLDDSIRFPDEVERETGTAVLGVVPKLKLADSKGHIALGAHIDTASSFSEAYRSVRTALQFSTASGAPRCLVVTSSSKNEGKSTTALALAINFAQLGKPVLLVDGDLRNPVLHKMLKLDNSRGLSNYLSSNVSVQELVQKTEIPNVFVLTTGPLPPNPVELLAGMRLLTMLRQCEEHFAHVIVDAPPVLGIADSIVLSNQVDNMVFVIESGRTRKGHVRAALKRLHLAGVRPLGVILTKIDSYHDEYGYNSYYYQYPGRPSIADKKVAES